MSKLSLKGGLAELLTNSVVSENVLEGDRLLQVQCDKIDPNPTQPRKTIDSDFFEQMCISISAKGVQVPIIVRPGGKPGRFTLIAGQQRLKGCIAMNLPSIPAIVREVDDETAHLVAIIENATRAPLPVIEEAVALNIMKDQYDWSQVKLAKTLGKTEKWVSEMMALVGLPKSILAAANAGYISHLSMFTQLRLAHKKNATVVDKFLGNLREPVTFTAAKSLHERVSTPKTVKVAKAPARLSENAIKDRVNLATKNLQAGAELTNKQLSALDLLTQIYDGVAVDEQKMRLIALTLFPGK